ncbi:MAG TPA: GNAT family N-acetyltransferase [Acidobacteriota bacterium]|nr:GNAT family N-acetyltransferase [Acidobacteriota bacterium]
MPAMTTIRRAATPQDLETARALFREYAAGLGFGLEFQEFEAELAGLPGAYAEPEGCLLLADVEGRPAGCVALRPHGPPGTCEMKRLYVVPAFRGLGVGRRLAEAIVEEARARGYRRLRLDTVPGMDAAIAVYRSLGFREIPPYRFNPIEGALFFEADLPGRENGAASDGA